MPIHMIPALLLAATVAPATPATWDVLAAVNFAYLDFFLNWHHHFAVLNTSAVVNIVAEDAEAHRQLLAWKHNKPEMSGMNVLRATSTDESGRAHSFGSRGFAKQMSQRATYILNMLRKGQNVLFTDLDMVWRSDPFKHFVCVPKCPSHAMPCSWCPDMFMQVDAWSSTGTPDKYCGGFMAVFATNRSIAVMAEWERLLLPEPQRNQPLLNRVLRSSMIERLGVRYVSLDRELFPDGRTYFIDTGKASKLQQPRYAPQIAVLFKAVVIHNNWIAGHDAKMRRFQATGMWKVSRAEMEELHQSQSRPDRTQHKANPE